jgi:hypothetical protein
LAPGVQDAWRFIFLESKIEVRHFHIMAENDSPLSRKDLQTLEARIDKKFEDMSEQMRDIETALLRAFQNYAQGVAAQIQKLTASDSATEIRMAALENRVLELETRRRN